MTNDIRYNSVIFKRWNLESRIRKDTDELLRVIKMTDNEYSKNKYYNKGNDKEHEYFKELLINAIKNIKIDKTHNIFNFYNTIESIISKYDTKRSGWLTSLHVKHDDFYKKLENQMTSKHYKYMLEIESFNISRKLKTKLINKSTKSLHIQCKNAYFLFINSYKNLFEKIY